MSEIKQINNKWSGDKYTLPSLPLSPQAFEQPCVVPVKIVLTPSVGEETILCFIDPTDFIHELASLKPFRLFLPSGVVKTDYGPVAFFLFAVMNPESMKPFALIEHTLNPFDTTMFTPYHDLARQTHWHVFLLANNRICVRGVELPNTYKFDKALSDFTFMTQGMSCSDFSKAKEQFRSTYTIDDLFKMAWSSRSSQEPYSIF